MLRPRPRPLCKSAPMAFSAANPLLPSSPTVLHAAWWWSKASSGRPHKQVQTVKGRGMRRRRSKRTRNGSESIFDTRWTGNAVNGTDARGPLCDLTRARWSGDNRSHTTWSLWCSWTGCVLLPSMAHLTRLTFGITCLWPQPSRKCFPWWDGDAHLPQTSARLLHSLHVSQTDGHSVDDLTSTPRMPLLDHLQTICPTTPMGSVPDLRTAPDTQTAKVKGREATSWVCDGNSSTCKMLLRHCNTFRSTPRILFGVLWRHGSEPTVGSRRSTENKQQPSNLDVIDEWDSFTALFVPSTWKSSVQQ